MDKYIRTEGLRVYFVVNQQSFQIYEALPDEPESVEWMKTQLKHALNTLKEELKT